jgi:hypothetical protein
MLHFLDYFLGIAAIVGAVIMIILGIMWINFHRNKPKASKIRDWFFMILTLTVIVFAADMFIEHKINKNIEYHKLNAPVKIIPDSNIDVYDGNTFYTDKNGVAKMNFEVGKYNYLKVDDKYSKVSKKNNNQYIITTQLPSNIKKHEIIVFSFNKKHKEKDISVNLINEDKKQQAKQNIEDKEADKEFKEIQKEQKNKKNQNKQIQKQKTNKQADKQAKGEGEDALTRAEGYAETQNLSKQGIYDQLTSKYGEGFSPAAAQYAINRLKDVDWNENALSKAQDYKDTQHLSTNEIYSQLTSSYGEKFTPSEAQYAINHLH